MLTGRCTADPHKTVYKQNHTRGQSKLQLCALFIVAATPRSSSFFGVFLLGRTFVTLPLYSLPLAPHFALFLGLGGTSWVAPQSLRGVSPGDVVGGKQAWTPQGARSCVVVPPSLCGVRAPASSGEGKQVVKGTEAWFPILPLLLTCSVTPEKDPPLSGPVALPVNQISLQ